MRQKKRNKKSWNFCVIYFIKTMKTYCVSCKKYTTDQNWSLTKTKQNRLMLLPSCAISEKQKKFLLRIKLLYSEQKRRIIPQIKPCWRI